VRASGGGRGPAGKEALNAPHQGVEGRAGVALAEVGRGEAPDEAVDAEAAHGLVAEAEAGERVASHDQAPALDDLAVLVDTEDTRPERLAGATGEDAEVVGILEVLREHDVTYVEEGRKLGDREVPDTPGVLKLVGESSVEDEAPPGRRGLVDCAKRLDVEREGAVSGHHFHDALPRPGSELGTKSDLGGLIALPAGVVGTPGRAERETGLGHGGARNDRRRRGVKRAKALVPDSRRVVDRHDIAIRTFGKFNVRGKEAGLKGCAPRRGDQGPGGGRERARQERVGGGDGDEAVRGKIKAQGVSGVRFGQDHATVRCAAWAAQGGGREDAAVSGEMSIREAGEQVEGVGPRSADSERVEKGADCRREGYGRGGPGELVRQERVRRNGLRRPGGGRDHEGELGVEELALGGGPVPSRTEERGAVLQQRADPVM